MLKLKYLFANYDLAKQALNNWGYDIDSIDKMLQYYRISSNAVYPHKYEGKVRILRIAPVDEKIKNNIIGELEFIKYLLQNNYPALKPVASKNGKLSEVINSEWGDYYVSNFEKVSGVKIEDTDYSDEIMAEYGKTLGRLHKLSAEYEPKTPKWTHEDVLNWCYDTLKLYGGDENAITEVNLLKEYFSNLPKTKQNYGLIHYDFEPDNVFYDKNYGTCNVIDFDDGMYHWFLTDIEQALDSIKHEIDEQKFSRAKECFINGYKSEFAIPENMLLIMPAMRRFCDLYSYVRILRATHEQLENEPEWMQELRVKLNKMMNSRAKHFGKPI